MGTIELLDNADKSGDSKQATKSCMRIHDKTEIEGESRYLQRRLTVYAVIRMVHMTRPSP
jgi:hypothetical protein